MNPSHSSTRNPKLKRQKKRRQLNDNKLTQYSFFKSPTRIVPSETVTTLVWPSSFVLTSVGAQNVSKRWVTNGAYDFDPVLASTATPGFAEFAAFYGFYRVISYKYDFQMVNAQAFPITAYICNTDNDTGITALNYEAYSVANYGTAIVLSPVGTTGANCQVSNTHTISQIVGSSAPETEDNYRALVTAIPADLTWLGLGLRTNSATNLMTAAGVYVQLRLSAKIRFYARKELTQ